MSKTSCSLVAHCKNSKGEVVESRLFKDLLKYTSNNRELTKEYYGVAINLEFLSRVSDKAKFDENGELTLGSLLDEAKLNLEEDKVIEKLNKEIEAGEYSYEEAIVKLQGFNRSHSLNNRYLATVSRMDGGKYRLSIVKRDAKNEGLLEREIANRTLQDRVKYYLNKAGVSVAFIENDEKVNGRYSTINAKRTANGLYQLIEVANGEHIDETLAEEAGHFAIGALGNSPLVERLMRLLTPEVQERILGDKYYGSNPQREAAGTLVGKAIAGNIDIRGPWEALVDRIIAKAKSIFYTLKRDDVSKAIIESELIAEQIAKGFMSSEFNGNVETALQIKETLYDAPISVNVKTYRKALNTMKLLAEEMSVINAGLGKRFKDLVSESEKGSSINTPGVTSDAIALQGIAEMVTQLSDLMISEIPDLLNSVDFSNKFEFFQNMPANGKKLRAVRTYVRNAVHLLQIINDVTSSIPGKERIIGDPTKIMSVDSYGNTIYYNLTAIAENLGKLLSGEHNNGLVNTLINSETQFFLKFLESSLGRNYVDQSTRVIFKKANKGGKTWFNRWIIDVEVLDPKDPTSISKLLTELEGDISLRERYLASMSDNSDIIGQICDVVVKESKKRANDMTNQAQDRLRVLKAKLEKIGVTDTSIFYEKENVDDEHGNKIGERHTGNIISEHRWGRWEENQSEFRKNEFEKFNAHYGEDFLNTLSEYEKAQLWNNWYKPAIKDWHRLNSEWDKHLMMYIPNDNYHNKQYDKIIASHPERESWLKEYMELKGEIDSKLPEGSIPFYRMPQFKGTFINKVRNRRLDDSNTLKATGKTIVSTLRDTFCEDSEDTEFGSSQTYNNPDEDLFGNKLSYELEKLHRVPLYGINKLADPNELSTDIFHSTLAFAGMANSYFTLSTVVDTLEVGTEVLNRRSAGGIKDESQRKEDKSRAYTRFIKYMDKQVYGIGLPKIKINNKIVLTKISSALSGLAGKYFLGGNVAGGLVNVGTGSIEIFKEAASGEYYNLKDWAKANKMYFSPKDMIHRLWDSGKDIKEDKVSLFIRHFDILQDSEERSREWHTKHWRIYNVFSESLFLPYKLGEHYMQSMSYLALANGTKLYSIDGDEVSLFDAYSPQMMSDSTIFGRVPNKKYGKTLELNDVYFKSKENLEEYKRVKTIIDRIENSIALDSLDQQYLINNGYSTTELDITKRYLSNRLLDLQWNETDESEFINKAREINNRLHGIYNNIDKVALQQDIFGNMLLAMRGYALGMIERRFSGDKYSVILGKNAEGSLTTMAKVIASMGTDRQGFGLTIRALLLPWSKKSGQLLKNAGYSENQIANMTRNGMDAMFILALTLLKLATAKPKGGDDDEEEEEVDTSMGVAYYFASRLLREQAGFNTIRGITNETNNLANLVPAGFSALMDIGKTAYLAGGSVLYPAPDDDELEYLSDWELEMYKKFYYQSSKEGRYEKGDPRWEVRFWRMFPYLRSKYVFEYPYDAAQSYEYGQKVKN